MSGYWHDGNYTAVGVVPAGSVIGKFECPVEEGNIAIYFDGDETTVIEGDKDRIIFLLELALKRVRGASPHEPIPADYLPEGTYYWPYEWEERPDFITRDGGDTWIPLCSCGRDLTPLTNGNSSANWECTNYDYHGRLQIALLFAEDWPDYDEDDEH